MLNGALEKLKVQVKNLAQSDPVQSWIINSPISLMKPTVQSVMPSNKQGLGRVVEPKG